MFTSTRPSSQSYHVATVTGDPSGRTVAMTAEFGFARKASSSGGSGGPGTRPSLPPAAFRFQPMPGDSPTYAPMLAGTSQGVPAGRRLALRDQVGRLPRDRARTRRRRAALVAQRQEPRREAGRRRRRAARGADARRTACSTASCARSTRAALPSFELFQRGEGDVAYVVFDVLEIDGEPVFAEPWSRRRELLEELIRPGAPSIVLSQVFDDGEALLAAARARGLEGVMAKRVNAPYRPGRRSDDWRKIKIRQKATLRIAGYTAGEGSRSSLGALMLATDDLEYAGNCGSGLSDADVRELLDALAPLRRDTSPLRGAGPTGAAARSRITWVEPSLSCEVGSPSGRASAGCARPSSSGS